jgi:hypothetical protein
MNSSQIFPDCKISAPIPGLACATVAISHIAFWVEKTHFGTIARAIANRAGAVTASVIRA